MTLQFQIVATHHKMAQVARLMGFTVEGLVMLSADVTDEWQSIGRTRSIRSATGPIPGDNVLARRPKYFTCVEDDCDVFIHGALEFSIGVKGLVLTDELMREQLARDAMARELVARVIQSRSFTVDQLDKVIASLNGNVGSHSNGLAIQRAAERVVSPLAPRGPDS